MTAEARPLPWPDGPLVPATDAVLARLEAIAVGVPPPAFEFDAADLPAFADLRQIFGLQPAETALLLLAAAQEVDRRVGDAILRASGVAQATVSLAAAFAGPGAWQALSAAGRLRHWRLLELSGGGNLSDRRIRLDERILDHFLGQSGPDARLDGLVRPVFGTDSLPADLQVEADRLSQAFAQAGDVAPMLGVSGGSASQRRDLIAHVARMVGLSTLCLDAADIPTAWAERHAAAIYLDREMALSRALLLIEGTGGAVDALADRITGPVAVSADEPPKLRRSAQIRADLPAPVRRAQHAFWSSLLDKSVADNCIDSLSAQFDLSPDMIAAIAAETEGSGDRPVALWQAARRCARESMEGLAQAIDSQCGWDDLVLPRDQVTVLRELGAQIRQAWQVHAVWGWARKSGRGLGTAALFAGPSGTGKTLAAEVLATDLQLDLFRVDLSQIVSKYIGETEKNLSRIFKAAERGGAILLFDEADALFGKRSEVKDSHDRYANVEVSYLLQQMEAYRGLAILTTNQRSAVDRAFLRRLRHVVVFPFPDFAARAAIWARIFPPETPLEDVDPGRLARLSLAGGTIRSIALNAAFLAATEESAVGMQHIHRAARREYSKIEKPFTATDAEVFR
ncbi:MAG: ATP-binding protein [Pseudomonadota bacterium]